MQRIIFRQDSKQLNRVNNISVFSGEKDVDFLEFLIPLEYNGIDLSDCNVRMSYVTGNGFEHSFLIDEYKKEELYENEYFIYLVPVSPRFTSVEGTVNAYLSITKTVNGEEQKILKTGDVEILIRDHLSDSSQLNEEDIEIIDQVVLISNEALNKSNEALEGIADVRETADDAKDKAENALDAIEDIYERKQNKLTQGPGITIVNDVISATAVSDTYTKEEIDIRDADTLDAAKAYVDGNTYTKSETDTLLSTKANASDVYTKAETYSQQETDLLLNTKADASEVYTKNEINEIELSNGQSLQLTIDSSTYVVTAILKNSEGTALSTQTIDLPLESVVVGGHYDSQTKKVVLELKNGDTIEFSVADLVSGLVSQSDFDELSDVVDGKQDEISVDGNHIEFANDTITGTANKVWQTTITNMTCVALDGMVVNDLVIDLSERNAIYYIATFSSGIAYLSKVSSVMYGNGLPQTTSTGAYASPGITYVDETNHKVYVCSNKVSDGGAPPMYTYTWIEIGAVDLSNYYTKDETDNLLDDKQDEITVSGNHIEFADNEITSTANRVWQTTITNMTCAYQDGMVVNDLVMDSSESNAIYYIFRIDGGLALLSKISSVMYGEGLPPSTTYPLALASPGITYVDEANHKVYVCSNRVSDGETPPTYTYTWIEIAQGGSNPYSSISRIEDYTYKVVYDDIDYSKAFEYFSSMKPEPNISPEDYSPNRQYGSCNAFYTDGLVGRTFDWFYSNVAEFVCYTPARTNTKQVVGVCKSEALTKDIVDSGKYNELFDILPFELVDGMNEDGLFVSMLVCQNDKGITTGTIPSSETELELCTLMLPRWALDNFSTVNELLTELQTRVSVFNATSVIEYGYEIHYFVADKTGNRGIIEFIDNQVVFIQSDICTNFIIEDVVFNNDGSVYTPGTQTNTYDAITTNKITEHGSGLERYNLINDELPEITDIDDVKLLLDSLKYTKTYDRDENPFWYTEFVGNDYHCNTPTSVFDASGGVVETAISEYQKRDRNNPTTWQTVHSGVYDLENTTMYLSFQENQIRYEFGFDYYTINQVNMLLDDKADKVQVTSADAGKVMMVDENGEWTAQEVDFTPSANTFFDLTNGEVE